MKTIKADGQETV